MPQDIGAIRTEMRSKMCTEINFTSYDSSSRFIVSGRKKIMKGSQA